MSIVNDSEIIKITKYRPRTTGSLDLFFSHSTPQKITLHHLSNIVKGTILTGEAVPVLYRKVQSICFPMEASPLIWGLRPHINVSPSVSVVGGLCGKLGVREAPEADVGGQGEAHDGKQQPKHCRPSPLGAQRSGVCAQMCPKIMADNR